MKSDVFYRSVRSKIVENDENRRVREGPLRNLKPKRPRRVLAFSRGPTTRNPVTVNGTVLPSYACRTFDRGLTSRRKQDQQYRSNIHTTSVKQLAVRSSKSASACLIPDHRVYTAARRSASIRSAPFEFGPIRRDDGSRVSDRGPVS